MAEDTTPILERNHIASEPKAGVEDKEGAHDDDDDDNDDDDDDDDDWAPEAQGAADVKATEQEALAALLRPTHLVQKKVRYETKREADAAGRMLYELKRPPTIMEAKEDIPKGEVDNEKIGPPKYRNMSQEEGLDMVERGATVNLHGQHGRTPLHKACEKAHPLLAKAICNVGGDPDIRDNFGETPLLLMAHSLQQDEDIPRARRTETIQMMLACGADVHAVNPRGRGVLHMASTENDHAAIETFIEGMADVNTRDLAGFTALMWAAGRNGSESVKMLLDYRADMTLQANRGQTAMTFALTNGCDAIVDVLERHKMLLDKDAISKQQILAREAPPAEAPQEEVGVSETGASLQLPKPEWACKHDPPEEMEPYAGRRVYPMAKPDRRSNVYV